MIGYRSQRSARYDVNASRVENAVLAGQVVPAVAVELAGSGVDGDGDLVARGPPGRLDGLDQHPHGLLVGGQVRGEAALVADGRRQTPLVQHRLQPVIGLGAPLQRLGERGGPDRDDHELLQVDVVVGVSPAVDDVHHRHRKHMGAGPPDVAEDRQARLFSGGPGHRQRDAQDGVGAQAALVGRAIEVDQGGIETALVERLKALNGRGDLAVDVLDGPPDALPAVTIASVAKLDGLVGPGRRPRGHGSPPRGAGGQQDLGLHGWIAPGVEYLPPDQLLDLTHGSSWWCCGCCGWCENGSRSRSPTRVMVAGAARPAPSGPVASAQQRVP